MSKGRKNKGKKLPDDSWVRGTIRTVPIAKDRPYKIGLVDGRVASLSRNVAKKDVGYDRLAVGVALTCDLNDRGEDQCILVRHCALATP